ncbi:MAG TPA: tail fiber protein [Propionibacteriaceae bacterium]|nr:tail fiber protein [Propionibacteriaceae bacterium]
MSEPFIGEIRLFPYDFAPRGWAFCHGQLLSIVQNTSLFALLGTTYGGDGRITFALPDLRGRVAVSSGQGPGLSAYELGGVGGAESVTLTEAELPTHTHQVSVNGRASSSSKPGNHYLGRASSGTAYASTANGTLNPDAVVPAGGGEPHENRPPHLTLNYCIALAGIFPSRD